MDNVYKAEVATCGEAEAKRVERTQTGTKGAIAENFMYMLILHQKVICSKSPIRDSISQC